MRRIAMLSAMLLVAFSLFAVSSDDIESAAAQLNVPYNELEALVLKYNSADDVSNEFDVITLEKIYEDFVKNGIRADMKYDGKTIRVRFRVDKMYENPYYNSEYRYSEYRYVIDGYSAISLGYWANVLFSVHLDDSQAGKLMNISPRQTITVEGKCEVDGSLFTNIDLVDARII